MEFCENRALRILYLGGMVLNFLSDIVMFVYICRIQVYMKVCNPYSIYFQDKFIKYAMQKLISIERFFFCNYTRFNTEIFACNYCTPINTEITYVRYFIIIPVFMYQYNNIICMRNAVYALFLCISDSFMSYFCLFYCKKTHHIGMYPPYIQMVQ